MNRHLHIHCGLHKTASTSFQKYLHLNREALRNAGVIYPQYGETFQHSLLLWEIQKKGLDVAKKYLASLLDTDTACGACLISGEDFENYIYNTNAASMFEEMALDLGFKSVTWHVVVRPMKDYVNSLYNELSKHEVLIKRKTLELAARERGCFFVSTNNYNYIFTLDYQRFSSQFRKSVRSIKEYDFSEFCDGEIGWPLLRSIIPLKRQERFQKEAMALSKKDNHSVSKIRIEGSYLLTRFGLESLKANPFIRKLLCLPPLDWKHGKSRDRQPEISNIGGD